MSTITRTKSSRKRCPWCRQIPWMICVSHETAPKRCSSSSRVSVINSRGTGWPSLNFNGSRISQRRQSLICGRTFHGEADFLLSQQSQDLFRQHHFAAGPTLEREPASQLSQCLAFGGFVGKSNDDHGLILTLRPCFCKPGVIIVPDSLEIGAEISDLALVVERATADEMQNVAQNLAKRLRLRSVNYLLELCPTSCRRNRWDS